MAKKLCLSLSLCLTRQRRVSKMDKYNKRTSKSPIDSPSQVSHEVDIIEQEPPSDPALRPLISQYNPNERDRIRRFYLVKGPCQPNNHDFPQRDIGDTMRRFNKDWFKPDQYGSWLEYSIDKDAAFCLCCYFFRPENLGSGGRTNFIGEGYRNWKNKKRFDEHVGDTNSWLNQRQCIQTIFEKQTVRQKMDYRVQLNASVGCARFLAKQGLAFHRHDEFESSSNKGNFLEILRFLGDHNEFINKVVLDKAPQNLRLTSLDTQKDIVNAAAKETTKEIIAELGDDLFAVLVDKSRDVSFKEQMAVVIRFVNNKGSVFVRFLGIVHVYETTSLSLKAALEDLLGKNGLSLSRLRGQGYDGASNMRVEFNGLKTLIMKENSTA
ncbi:uncharacterized protein LOC144547158 [Carex rostrata]